MAQLGPTRPWRSSAQPDCCHTKNSVRASFDGCLSRLQNRLIVIFLRDGGAPNRQPFASSSSGRLMVLPLPLLAAFRSANRFVVSGCASPSFCANRHCHSNQIWNESQSLETPKKLESYFVSYDVAVLVFAECDAPPQRDAPPLAGASRFG